MIINEIRLIRKIRNKAYFLDPLTGRCIVSGQPRFLLQAYNDYKAKQAQLHGFLNSPTLLLIQDEINHGKSFGFHSSMIEEIYRHHQKDGWGFWYKINDGRVFDSLGKERHNELNLLRSGKV